MLFPVSPLERLSSVALRARRSLDVYGGGGVSERLDERMLRRHCEIGPDIYLVMDPRSGSLLGSRFRRDEWGRETGAEYEQEVASDHQACWSMVGAVLDNPVVAHGTEIDPSVRSER